MASLSTISRGGLKFIVLDSPSSETSELYASELEAQGVHHLVRTYDSNYPTEFFSNRGILIHNMVFTDGSAPPEDILDEWLELVNSHFFEGGKIKKDLMEPIAVHCLSGLGRAPVLIAIALIEAGLDPSHAIDLIRRNRQGALNQKQINFLMRYKRKGVFNKSCCMIM